MRQAGAGLVSVIIAVGIAGVVAVAMMRILGGSFDAQASLESRNDIEAIRMMVLRGIDCGATMAPIVDPVAECDSTSTTQDGPWLRLYRRTSSGASVPLTTAWNASTGEQTVGRWQVRASCSEAEKSLVVRVARRDGTGAFALDKLTKRAWDWSTKGGLIFGAATMPLCYDAPAVPTPFSPSVRIVSAQGGVGPNSIATAVCNGDEAVTGGDCQCHGAGLWINGVAYPNGYNCACLANHAYTRARAYCMKK